MLIPLRIAYLCYEDFSKESGVTKKICLQAKHWSIKGNDVLLIVPKMRGSRIEATQGLEIFEFDYPLGSKKYFDPEGMGIRETRNFRPDIIYNRYSILPPWHLSLAREFALVFEINSEESEFALFQSSSKRFLYRLWRKRFLKSAAGAVFISKELSEKPAFRLLTPRTVIANGIDQPDLNQRQLLDREPGPARLFFIGNGKFPWHGIEKLAQLATSLPDIEVDIVGDACPKHCPSNVRYHGQLTKNRYLPMLQRADVAIGPLSLYTKSISEASPLKVREYLSLGVPTIIAYKDTDISSTTELTLHIPNHPENVSRSMSSIAAFIESSKGKRIEWEAVSNLDAKVKESQRLAFFRSCLLERSRRNGHR